MSVNEYCATSHVQHRRVEDSGIPEGVAPILVLVPPPELLVLGISSCQQLSTSSPTRSNHIAQQHSLLHDLIHIEF